MTIKGLKVNVNVGFEIGEFTIDETDIKAIAEADTQTEKMYMIRKSANNVIDDMSSEKKDSLGQVIIDTIAKELGAAVKEQFASQEPQVDDTEESDDLY